MIALFLFAVLLLGAWFIAVAAFHVTAAAIHILLALAVVLFAIGFLRRRFEPRRRHTV